jgi:hypothetical protein
MVESAILKWRRFRLQLNEPQETILLAATLYASLSWLSFRFHFVYRPAAGAGFCVVWLFETSADGTRSVPATFLPVLAVNGIPFNEQGE